MHSQQQSPSNDGKRKPWYRAIDFKELLDLTTQEQRQLYAQAESAGNATTPLDPQRLRAKLAETAHELLLLAKGSGKEVQVTCPNPACSSKNRRCFIHRSTGVFHCWVCGMSGRLKEFHHEHRHTGSADTTYYNEARAADARNNDYVAMLPSDYKPVDIAVMSCLYPIFPLDEEQTAAFLQKFHPADATVRNRKSRLLLTPQQQLSLQSQVQRYCQAMGWSREVLEREGVMCAYMSVKAADDAKSEDPQGSQMQPAIAYCNHLLGKIVNVKFRSVSQDPLTGQWSKHFYQESPTTPIAPYGIDSICPLRPEAEPIRQLVFTEGEKDRLTLLSCGIPYALSIANGAATNIRESHEAFEKWIEQADDIIVCGDTDRPGRGLVRRLLDHYPAGRCCPRDTRTSARYTPSLAPRWCATSSPRPRRWAWRRCTPSRPTSSRYST